MFSVKPDQVCTGTHSVQQKPELVPELVIETCVSKLLLLLLSSLGAPFFHSCQGLEQKVPYFSVQPIYCPRLSWYLFGKTSLKNWWSEKTKLDEVSLCFPRHSLSFVCEREDSLPLKKCFLISHCVTWQITLLVLQYFQGTALGEAYTKKMPLADCPLHQGEGNL